eukprot:2698633-Rhodomonas_salina.1
MQLRGLSDMGCVRRGVCGVRSAADLFRPQPPPPPHGQPSNLHPLMVNRQTHPPRVRTFLVHTVQRQGFAAAGVGARRQREGRHAPPHLTTQKRKEKWKGKYGASRS